MDDASLAPDKSSSALSQAELDALTDRLVEKLKIAPLPGAWPISLIQLAPFSRVFTRS